MPALTICRDRPADELRRLARREPDRRTAMRPLATANRLEGRSRSEAAGLAGVERQALRDAVLRYDAAEPRGLHDRPRSSRPEGFAPGRRRTRHPRRLRHDLGHLGGALGLFDTGLPFVRASPPPHPALAGSETFPLGVRVDNSKLLDLNAFRFTLEATPGFVADPSAVAQGRRLFRAAGCTACHDVDQGRFVPTVIVPVKRIFPGDDPTRSSSRSTRPR